MRSEITKAQPIKVRTRSLVEKKRSRFAIDYGFIPAGAP
jgi:hypothetical protein